MSEALWGLGGSIRCNHGSCGASLEHRSMGGGAAGGGVRAARSSGAEADAGDLRKRQAEAWGGRGPGALSAGGDAAGSGSGRERAGPDRASWAAGEGVPDHRGSDIRGRKRADLWEQARREQLAGGDSGSGGHLLQCGDIVFGGTVVCLHFRGL